MVQTLAFNLCVLILLLTCERVMAKIKIFFIYNQTSYTNGAKELCLSTRYGRLLLAGLYLRLIKVFNTNAVHDSSKRPGFLRLLEQW